MTQEEFSKQYKRLKDVFPSFYNSQEKMLTTWNFIKEMDEPWFKSLVDRIVMGNRPDKVDIGEAVINEKRNRKFYEFSQNIIASIDVIKTTVSEKGLDNALEKYQANNLLEAIEKSRKGNI